MSQRICRNYQEPIREGLSWEEKWRGDDQGLIISWETGRKISKKDPDLAYLAKKGELPTLDWKGGVDKKLKLKKKYGTLFYLAQWQALRGENLDIDLSKEVEHTCTKTGVKVIYTHDIKKYCNA